MIDEIKTTFNSEHASRMSQSPTKMYLGVQLAQLGEQFDPQGPVHTQTWAHSHDRSHRQGQALKSDLPDHFLTSAGKRPFEVIRSICGLPGTLLEDYYFSVEVFIGLSLLLCRTHLIVSLQNIICLLGANIL